MKKFNVLFITLVLMTSMLFIGCDMFGGEETVTYTLSADDGFKLVSATVAFSTSSSVAELSETNYTNYEERYYAPTDLADLEDGDAPVISFTFNEDLRDSELEAVFSFLDDDMAASTSTATAYSNTFWNDSSALDYYLTDISVSGSTVSFTFEEDTFEIDEDYIAAFGVVSDAGEAYTVITSFTAQADITETIDMSANYEDYYAYAVDSDRVYVLELADEGDHIDDPTAAQDLASVTSISSGEDFGASIQNLEQRATYSSAYANHDEGIYASVLDLYNNGYYIEYIPIEISAVEYASWYTFYHVDSDDNATELSASLSETIYEDETADELVTTGYIYDVSVYDDISIETGDMIVCVPSNNRDDYEDCAASISLTDSMHPFRADAITMSDTSTFTWTGVDYTNPDGDETTDDSHDTDLAHDEGHLVYFSNWDVTSLTGFDDTDATDPADYHEGYLYTLTSSSLAADSSENQSAGSQIAWTDEDEVRDEIAEYFSTDETWADFDFANMTLVPSDSSRMWAFMNGSTVHVFGGINCNDGTGAINYATNNEIWTASGNLGILITDASGNELFFNDGTDQNDGALSITINE